MNDVFSNALYPFLLQMLRRDILFLMKFEIKKRSLLHFDRDHSFRGCKKNLTNYNASPLLVNEVSAPAIELTRDSIKQHLFYLASTRQPIPLTNLDTLCISDA